MEIRTFVISVALLAAISLPVDLAAKKQPLYRDASAPVEDRVEDLLSRMTLQEKIQ